MEILFGCDHNADSQKYALIEASSIFGEVSNISDDANISGDYIHVTEKVCRLMDRHLTAGLLICGTGIGVSIIANKHKGIFAARCTSESDARDCRRINQANVLCLSAKTDVLKNILILKAFFDTPIGNSRKRMHRLEQIHRLERKNFI